MLTNKSTFFEKKSPPHKAVLLDDFIEMVKPIRGCWIDCTFGAGGYSRALLLSGADKVIAIDKDPMAYVHFELLRSEFGSKIEFFQQSFSNLEENEEVLLRKQVDGIVFDLGVSSMHLDKPERGFSFKRDGPLDMRMDSSGHPSAFDVVNFCSEKVLADIIFYYGEEKKAFKIAKKIVNERKNTKITNTSQLADLVRSVLPSNFKTDPATRTFQAIRIAVNDELNELSKGLNISEKTLKANGILAVITFHSLEDRLVKEFGKMKSGRVSRGSRYGPDTEASKPTLLPINNRVRKPTQKEINENARARSGKLRVFRKTGVASSIECKPLYYPKIELGLN